MNPIEKILPEGKEFREAILEAEAIMLASMPPVESELVHHFAPGVYMRELRIKAGTLLTGKIHKTAHLCTLNGDISISSEEGNGRFTGYVTFLSKPGIKRIGYAHKDTVFSTIHAIEGTDIPTLEDALVVDTYEQYERHLIQRDYEQVLIEFNFTPDLVKQIVENSNDQMAMPREHTKLSIGKSPIHGLGMFATKDILQGEYLAPARIGDKRTPAGRYINHSPNPNIEFRESAALGIDAYALHAIKKGEEVTVNYRQVASVNGVFQ